MRLRGLLRKLVRKKEEGIELLPDDVFVREFTVEEQMQVLPYMIEPRRTSGWRSIFSPRRSHLFPGRRRDHVQPVGAIPSYEFMLQLDENNPKRGVKLEVLDRLPVVCPPDTAAAEGCLICLKAFPLEGAKKLPCCHLFCEECIYLWLLNHRSCPICRSEFPDEATHLIIPK